MKNSIKLGALALVLAVTIASCGGNKSTSTTDTAKTTPDTAKHDTTATKVRPPDTAVKPKTDTTKKM